MKPMTPFRFFMLTRFGKPAYNRAVFKAVRNLKAQSIVELGLGDGSRAETMIRIAQKWGVTETIRYTGIDLFEAREDLHQKLTLKEMHKRLQSLGAKAQLAPGSPELAIPRIANTHLRTDLVIISGVWTAEELSPCWAYFPRMLHAQSVVMIQPAVDASFEVFSRLDIEKRASNQEKVQRAAAA